MPKQARHPVLHDYEQLFEPPTLSLWADSDTSNNSEQRIQQQIQQQIYHHQTNLTDHQQITAIIEAYKQAVNTIWRNHHETEKANFFDSQLDELRNQLEFELNDNSLIFQTFKQQLEQFYITINCITSHDQQQDYLGEFLQQAHECPPGSINRLQSLNLGLNQANTLSAHLSINVRPAIVRDLARKHCQKTGVPAGMEIHIETAFLHYANCEGFGTPVAAYEHDQFVDAPMLNINDQVLSQLYEQLRQQYTPYLVLKSACDYWRQVLPQYADLNQFDTLKSNIQDYWVYLKDKIAKSGFDVSQDFDTLWGQFCEQYYDYGSNQLISPLDLGEHLVNQAYTIAVEKQIMSKLGALQAAAGYDDLAAFKAIKDRYPNINEQIFINGGYGQYNPIFYAALYYGSHTIVGYYLEHNKHQAHADDPAKIDLGNIDGRLNSATQFVVQHGYINLIDQLVRYGIYPRHVNNVAHDIADLAIHYKQLNVIQAIKHGDILQNNACSIPSYHQLIAKATNRGCYDIAFRLLNDDNTDTHQLGDTDSHIRFDCLCELIDFIHSRTVGSLPATTHDQLMNWLDEADNALEQHPHPAYEAKPIVKLLGRFLSLSNDFYHKLVAIIHNHYDKLKSIHDITLFQQSMWDYDPFALSCLVNDVILPKPYPEHLRCFQINTSYQMPHVNAFTDLASYLLMHDLDSYKAVFLKGGYLSYQHLVSHNQEVVIWNLVNKTIESFSYANATDTGHFASICNQIAYQLNRAFNRATFQDQFDALLPTALTIYHSLSKLSEYAASVDHDDIAQQIHGYQIDFFASVSQIIQQHLNKLTNQLVHDDLSQSVGLITQLHEMSRLEQHGFKLNYNLWDQAGQHSLLYYVLCKFIQTGQHYNFVGFLLNRAEIDKSQDSLLCGALNSINTNKPANLLPDFLNRLLNWGADINKADEWGEAPVIKLFKQKESMRIILKTFTNSLLQRDDLDFNVVDTHGVSALELAAKNGYFIHLPDKYQQTVYLDSTSLQNLLVGAVRGNRTDVVKTLLTAFNRQMLHDKPINRQAILSSAIQAYSTTVFKLLLSYKLFAELVDQPAIKNDLVQQVLAKNSDCYKRMFHHIVAYNPGIATEVCAQEGMAPIHLAASNQLASVLTNLIISYEVDINQRDDHHNTPLHYLVTIQARNRASFTHFLNDFLDYEGINVNAVNDEGNTPLHLLIQHQHEQAACYLIGRMRYDCLDTANQEGVTPVQLAIQLGKVKIAKRLIESGSVNLDQANDQGQGLVQQAVQTPFMNSQSFDQLRPLIQQKTGVVEHHAMPTTNHLTCHYNPLDLLAQVSAGSGKSASTITRSFTTNEASSAGASQLGSSAASSTSFFSQSPDKRLRSHDVQDSDSLNNERTYELDGNEHSNAKRRRFR